MSASLHTDAAINARRYEWLREQRWNESNIAVVCDPKSAVKLGYDCPSGKRLDVIIDEAMQEKFVPEPDLLAALERLVRWAEVQVDAKASELTGDHPVAVAANQIKKAKGESV